MEFSPQGATRETEDHRVDLSSVTVLELSIIPDISGGNAHASLAQLFLPNHSAAALCVKHGEEAGAIRMNLVPQRAILDTQRRC